MKNFDHLDSACRANIYHLHLNPFIVAMIHFFSDEVLNDE